MTVATGYFDSIYNSGSGSGWQSLSNLTSGVESYAVRYIFDDASIQDVYFSRMGEIDGVPNGSQFEEMEVSLRARFDGTTGTASIRWEGSVAGVSVTGTLFEFGVSSGGYTTHTYSGDASYWGLSSYTPVQIFTAIRDGTLKLKYNPYSPAWGFNDRCYLDDVELSVTYTAVDTKRAALLTCVP